MIRSLFQSFFLIVFFFGCGAQISDQTPTSYIATEGNIIKNRVLLPDGFRRVEPLDHSFGDYLQSFPLKPSGSNVHLFDGTLKYTQEYHLAVLDIDTGNRDLQQCADAVMRLRAEHLYEQGRFDQIKFHFTNGFLADYSSWRSGKRIRVEGNKVNWYQTQKESKTYTSFRKYLQLVFSYAGTLSLSKELKEKELKAMNIGDVFIQGGSPGHAVIVVDMAIHVENGEKIFLIAQSYMPAQDIHIIKKNQNFVYGPWYTIKEIQETLMTPEWTFNPKDLKSF